MCVSTLLVTTVYLDGRFGILPILSLMPLSDSSYVFKKYYCR